MGYLIINPKHLDEILCLEFNHNVKNLSPIHMDGKYKADIRPGMQVGIVLKKDQKSGKITSGVVQNILTNSATHPHGIKVRLTDGQVGRVKKFL